MPKIGELQIPGGKAADKPNLKERQIFYATDSNELYIGNPAGTDLVLALDTLVSFKKNFLTVVFTGDAEYEFELPSAVTFINVRKAGTGDIKYFYKPPAGIYTEKTFPSSSIAGVLGGKIKITCDNLTQNVTLILEII